MTKWNDEFISADEMKKISKKLDEANDRDGQVDLTPKNLKLSREEAIRRYDKG